jgi:hypothetical protein
MDKREKQRERQAPTFSRKELMLDCSELLFYQPPSF